jgi:hypothetical protein
MEVIGLALDHEHCGSTVGQGVSQADFFGVVAG